MAIAILISTFGCCNGLILSGARVYYAMAKDGLFFKSTGKVHPKYLTPKNALIVQGIWTCVLCLSGTYNDLLNYVIFAVLVFYILTIAGLFVLRRTQAQGRTALSRHRLSGTAGHLYCDGFVHRCRIIALQTAIHVAGLDHCAAGNSGLFRVVAP